MVRNTKTPKPSHTHHLALSILFVLALVLVTLNFHGTFATLFAAVAAPMGHTQSVTFFTPYEEQTLSPGDTSDLDISINTNIPINAVGATIHFATDTIEILGISKKKSFLNLWTEETVIEENSGNIHFSGGTTVRGGLSGIGTLITVSVRAKKPGEARFTFEEVQVLASDGKGTVLNNEPRSYTYHIASSSGELAAYTGTSIASPEPAPEKPNPDLNGDGKVSLADISIMTVKLLGGYTPRYDLNMDGSVNIGDISTLFSQLGKPRN